MPRSEPRRCWVPASSPVGGKPDNAEAVGGLAAPASNENIRQTAGLRPDRYGSLMASSCGAATPGACADGVGSRGSSCDLHPSRTYTLASPRLSSRRASGFVLTGLSETCCLPSPRFASRRLHQLNVHLVEPERMVVARDGSIALPHIVEEA